MTGKQEKVKGVMRTLTCGIMKGVLHIAKVIGIKVFWERREEDVIRRGMGEVRGKQEVVVRFVVEGDIIR